MLRKIAVMSYKKKSALFISLHIVAWLIFFFAPFITYPLGFEFEIPRLFMQSVFMILMLSLFYSNYFILIPKFLEKRKIIVYFLILSAIIIVLSYIVDRIFIDFIKPTITDFKDAGPPPLIDHEHGHGHGPKPLERMPKGNIFTGVTFFSVAAILSLGVKMTSEWFHAENVKQELENDKLKAELSALKAQVNPHFFFNVMNNIASLARKKSDDTEHYIIKLSELMRYNLNDLTQEKVPLISEIDFIKTYIEIQYLRVPVCNKVEFSTPHSMIGIFIAPMLLFPFVENAFKYGVNYEADNTIRIQVKLENKSLVFTSENAITQNSSAISTGVGIENTRKRLELIYGKKYQLDISEENRIFSVRLTIFDIS